jgi:hypothetical protein
LRRKLEVNPLYRQLLALRGLDALPPSEKRSSLLYVPRSNELFWKAMPECLAPPFLGPALAGMAMMDGLTDGRCDRQRLGYWTYRMRPGGWGERVPPGRECEHAAKLGFSSYFRLDAPSAAHPMGQVVGIDCGGDRALRRRP